MKSYFSALCAIFVTAALCLSVTSCFKKDGSAESEDGAAEELTMSFVLEINVDEVIEALAGPNASDLTFRAALEEARAAQKSSPRPFLDLFIEKYQAQAGLGKLGSVYAYRLRDSGINGNSTDAQVREVLEDQISAATEIASKVIDNRLARYNEYRYEVEVAQGRNNLGHIIVKTSDIEDLPRTRRILSMGGNLEFWECFQAKEITQQLVSLDKKLSDDAKAGITAGDSVALASNAIQHPLLSVMAQAHPEGCVIGYVNKEDTTKVGKYLREGIEQGILDPDFVYGWGVKPVQASLFEVYALRKTNGGPALAGDVIESAKDDYDQYHKPVISMSMNTDGAREWAMITKKNLKRAVAIVLDGVVYCAPTIQSEICGGNIQICGNFSAEDTQDIVNVLTAGRLPCRLTIVSESDL